MPSLRRIKRPWARFWMRFAGLSRMGRLATRLAEFATLPYKGRKLLAFMGENGYIASSAIVHHDNLQVGEHAFIGDDVCIYNVAGGGAFRLGARSSIHKGCIVEMGDAGVLTIGRDTHIQPNCQLSVYKGALEIGDKVQIAPRCAFYPYNHRFDAGIPIKEQPLFTKGGIRIDDDVWLGYGVVVLDGVHIGAGAVIGANSVVTTDIPENAIAVGSPAKVIKMRD